MSHEVRLYRIGWIIRKGRKAIWGRQDETVWHGRQLKDACHSARSNSMIVENTLLFREEVSCALKKQEGGGESKLNVSTRNISSGNRHSTVTAHHLRYGSNQFAAAPYSSLTRESRGLIFDSASSAESFASLEMGSVCLPRYCISSQVCSTCATPMEADEPLRKWPKEESSLRSFLALGRASISVDGWHHDKSRTHKESSMFLKVTSAWLRYSRTMLDEKLWSSSPSSSSSIWPKTVTLMIG